MIPKYRIWSKTLHVMGEMTRLNFYKNAYHQVCFRYTDPTRKGVDGKNREVDESHLFDKSQNYMPVIFMQSTGLKDKNGVEIYEGDICKDSMGRTFVVEWDEENARFIGYTTDTWDINTEKYVHGERRICYVGREPKVEVIGNIHEEKADTT